MPTPIRTPDGGELSDVVAVSSSTLYAAGSAISNGTERAMLLHWNGSAWTEVPTPAGGSDPTLRGVTPSGAPPPGLSAPNEWAHAWTAAPSAPSPSAPPAELLIGAEPPPRPGGRSHRRVDGGYGSPAVT